MMQISTKNIDSVYTNNASSDAAAFRQGLHDGIPIGLGYFAVAFSLGIICRTSGLSVFQGFLTSLLNNTSAGEFAAITLIGQNASYTEIALVTLIANARYMLMSCALSQRLSSAQVLNPYYYYGGMAVAIPGWSIGTACGIVAGAALPERIVSALSVALFGMFLAIIMPPARESRIILTVVITSFIASFAATYMEPLAQLTGGTRTIILTVVIAAAAAWFRPVQSQQKEA